MELAKAKVDRFDNKVGFLKSSTHNIKGISGNEKPTNFNFKDVKNNFDQKFSFHPKNEVTSMKK